MLGVRAAENFTSDEARTWADSKGREVLNILTSENSAEKYQKLDEILQNDIDIDHAARFAEMVEEGIYPSPLF